MVSCVSHAFGMAYCSLRRVSSASASRPYARTTEVYMSALSDLPKRARECASRSSSDSLSRGVRLNSALMRWSSSTCQIRRRLVVGYQVSAAIERFHKSADACREHRFTLPRFTARPQIDHVLLASVARFAARRLLLTMAMKRSDFHGDGCVAFKGGVVRPFPIPEMRLPMSLHEVLNALAGSACTPRLQVSYDRFVDPRVHILLPEKEKKGSPCFSLECGRWGCCVGSADCPDDCHVSVLHAPHLCYVVGTLAEDVMNGEDWTLFFLALSLCETKTEILGLSAALRGRVIRALGRKGAHVLALALLRLPVDESGFVLEELSHAFSAPTWPDSDEISRMTTWILLHMHWHPGFARFLYHLRAAQFARGDAYSAASRSSYVGPRQHCPPVVRAEEGGGEEGT